MRTCIMCNSIIHTCIRVKDQGSQIYASYIRASYVYASRSRMADQGSWVYASYSQISGYTHHGHMHYAYMHQGYMHYAFMHHGQMHPEHMHLGCMHPLIKYHICMQHTYTHQGQVLGIKDLKYMHHTHSCQDTCIMHTASCVLDTRILDACILDTCILDVCIMDTCIFLLQESACPFVRDKICRIIDTYIRIKDQDHIYVQHTYVQHPHMYQDQGS